MNVSAVFTESSVENEELLEADHPSMNGVIEDVQSNEPRHEVGDLLAEEVKPEAVEHAKPEAPDVRERVSADD